MDEAFDQVTGEVHDAPISERALSAAADDRHKRRAAELGVGLTSIYAKLATAYADIAPVLAKEAEGQRGSYTKLDAVLKKVRKPLLDAGILIRQGADRVFSMGEGTQKSFWTTVYTDLIDIATGEVFRTELPMPIARPDPQAVGGVLTYGRRYTLLAALGIASGDPGEDDDADGSMPRNMAEESEADELIREFRATTTETEALKLKDTYRKRLDLLESGDFERVRAAFQQHVRDLRDAASQAPAPAPAKGRKKAGATT